MLGRLKNAFVGSKIFAFNQVRLDAWVADQARATAPGSLVLDVGAGSCPYRNLFQHCIYRAQDAVPLEPSQVRGKSGYGIIDYHCDATAIPVRDGEFDVVLCTEVLEHVPEPIRVIRELARVLKPGGKCILSAPLGSWLHQEPFHFYGGYTEHWYARFLPAAGFEELLIVTNRAFFSAFGQESIRFAFLSRPWSIPLPPLVRVVWFLPWLVLAPILVFVFPVLGFLLDRLAPLHGFTVGYFVTATRSVETPPSPNHEL